ncbi:hypothetical protein R0K20_17885, partial [Staphylococcus sp. SIMBA_130]
RFFATSQYPLTLSELYSIQIEASDRFLVELYSAFLFGHNQQQRTEEEIRYAVQRFVQKRLSRNSLMERESDYIVDKCSSRSKRQGEQNGNV